MMCSVLVTPEPVSLLCGRLCQPWTRLHVMLSLVRLRDPPGSTNPPVYSSYKSAEIQTTNAKGENEPHLSFQAISGAMAVMVVCVLPQVMVTYNYLSDRIRSGKTL